MKDVFKSALLYEKYVFNVFFFIKKLKVQIKSFKKIIFQFFWKDGNLKKIIKITTFGF